MSTTTAVNGVVQVLVANHAMEFACPPAANEVRAWVVDLEQPPLSPDVLFQRLTEEEQARAVRYKIAKAREQFVIGRGLLRGVLGAYLGLEPRNVPLTYLPSGKPILPMDRSLQFNVTHTDGIVVLAIGSMRLGVDVERVRVVPDAEGLVDRYFSTAEGAAFRALPESLRTAAFFRGWTSKEAVIKAAGATVSCLADFDVELHPHRAPGVNFMRNCELAGANWALTEWTTIHCGVVALAVETASCLNVDLLE